MMLSRRYRSLHHVFITCLVLCNIFHLPTSQSWVFRSLSSTSRCCRTHRLWSAAPENAAPLGELAAPRPPPLDPQLLQAASELLPWESIKKNDETTWQDGHVWAQTRLSLVQLRVLPRDPSNGADANYAAAATRQELKLLQAVPQLLRLETVVPAAQIVLQAGLPPAVLRHDPRLLSMEPNDIESTIATLKGSLGSSFKSTIRDAPHLLVDAIVAQYDNSVE